MNILITGGAGYIGSHVALLLLDNGIKPIIIDNLLTGGKKLIPKEANFIRGDISNSNLVSKIIIEHNISTVIHLAASTLVSESIKDPYKYYDNNTMKSINLVNLCGKLGVSNFIFSSTAACYGSKYKNKVCESFNLKPESPYGNSKLAVESAVIDLSKAYNFNYGIFRYFNVAGSDPDCRSGSIQKPASHLIAKACEVALKTNVNMEIYGDDYNTKDGTCIRDYIHVSDIASAHLKGIDYLNKKKHSFVSNLGYGHGYSVKEVLETVKKISRNNFPIKITSRRIGDIDSIVADNSFALSNLNWTPMYNNIELIVKHQYEWTKKSK